MTRQRNYETKIPFDGSEENLRLIHALGLGIIPPEVVEQLELVPGKDAQVYPRNSMPPGSFVIH